jgi:hypothetical protein
VEIHQHRACALAHEEVGGGKADAAGPAGDQRDLAVKRIQAISL